MTRNGEHMGTHGSGPIDHDGGGVFSEGGDDNRGRRSACSQRRKRAGRATGTGGHRQAAQWLNSPRLTATSLGGKVVLVDFCTYTCINWLRTLPYIRAWAQKYRQGLVVVGVHTPEFAFEQNIENVRRALQPMRIDYPIAIDNDYAIWRAFKNQYWPALYFIDARGRVREHHFGEGEYERSEKVIQRLLSEAGVGGIGEGIVSVDSGWRRGGGRLGQPEISRKLPRFRPNAEFRVPRRG